MVQFNHSDKALSLVEAQNVEKIYESSNLANLELDTEKIENARAFICVGKNASRETWVFAFFQVDDQEKFVRFAMSPEEKHSLMSPEIETLNWVESLGFLMKNIQVRKMNMLEQKEILKNLSFIPVDQLSGRSESLNSTNELYDSIRLLIASF